MTQKTTETTKYKKNKGGRPSEKHKIEEKVLIYLKKQNGNDQTDKQAS